MKRLIQIARAVSALITVALAASKLLHDYQFDNIQLAFLFYVIRAALPELLLMLGVAALISLPNRAYVEVWRAIVTPVSASGRASRTLPGRIWKYRYLASYASLTIAICWFLTPILNEGFFKRWQFYKGFFHKGFRDTLLVDADLYEQSFEYARAREGYDLLRKHFPKSFDETALDRKIRVLDGIVDAVHSMEARVNRYANDPARLSEAVRWCLQLSLLDPANGEWRRRLSALVARCDKLEGLLLEGRRIAKAGAKVEGQRFVMDANSISLQPLLGDILPDRADQRADYLWRALNVQTERFTETEHLSRLRNITGSAMVRRVYGRNLEPGPGDIEAIARRFATLEKHDTGNGVTNALVLRGKDKQQLVTLSAVAGAMRSALEGNKKSVRTFLVELSKQEQSAEALAEFLAKSRELGAIGTAEEFVSLAIDSDVKAAGFLRYLNEVVSPQDLVWDTFEAHQVEPEISPPDETGDQSESEPTTSDPDPRDESLISNDVLDVEPSPESNLANNDAVESRPLSPVPTKTATPQETNASPTDEGSSITATFVNGDKAVQETLKTNDVEVVSDPKHTIPQVIIVLAKRFGHSPRVLEELIPYLAALRVEVDDDFGWDRLPAALDGDTREAVIAMQGGVSWDSTYATACRRWIEAFDLRLLSHDERSFLCDRALEVAKATSADPLAWRLLGNLSSGRGYPSPLVKWIESETNESLGGGTSPEMPKTTLAMLSAIATGATDILCIREIESQLENWLATIRAKIAGNSDELESTAIADAIAEKVRAHLEAREDSVARSEALSTAWKALKAGNVNTARSVLGKVNRSDNNGPAWELLKAHYLHAAGKNDEALSSLEKLTSNGFADNGLATSLVSVYLDAKNPKNACRALSLALRGGTVNSQQIDSILTLLTSDTKGQRITGEYLRSVEEWLSAFVINAPRAARRRDQEIGYICDQFSNQNLKCVRAFLLVEADEYRAAGQMLAEIADAPEAKPNLLLMTLLELEETRQVVIPQHTRATIRKRAGLSFSDSP